MSIERTRLPSIRRSYWGDAASTSTGYRHWLMPNRLRLQKLYLSFLNPRPIRRQALQTGSQGCELERTDREQVELADIAHSEPGNLAGAFERLEGAEIAVDGSGVLAGFLGAFGAIWVDGRAAAGFQRHGPRRFRGLHGGGVVAGEFRPIAYRRRIGRWLVCLPSGGYRAEFPRSGSFRPRFAASTIRRTFEGGHHVVWLALRLSVRLTAHEVLSGRHGSGSLTSCRGVD